MNGAEKQRVLTAGERASLMAALASRGFYVIGEIRHGDPFGEPSVDRPDEASVEKRTQEPQAPADGS